MNLKYIIYNSVIKQNTRTIRKDNDNISNYYNMNNI